MPATERQKKKTAIYASILDAAIELFSTHGFDSVSTPQIAKTAGVSQPTIHYHFGTKLELWKEAVKSVYRKVEDQVDFDLNTFARSSPIDGLRMLYETLYKICLEAPEFGRFMMLEGQAGGPRLKFLYQTFLARDNEAFISKITDGISAGQIKPFDPIDIIFIMHGALVTYFNLSPVATIASGRNTRSQKNAERFFETYLDVVFDGIQIKN